MAEAPTKKQKTGEAARNPNVIFAVVLFWLATPRAARCPALNAFVFPGPKMSAAEETTTIGTVAPR